jgi:hypothetical protein
MGGSLNRSMRQFADAKQPIRELVLFHFDTERQWRVSGYTGR